MISLTDWGVADAALQSPETSKGAGAAPWVLGGILLLSVLGVYALETKGPAPLRRASK